MDVVAGGMFDEIVRQCFGPSFYFKTPFSDFDFAVSFKSFGFSGLHLRMTLLTLLVETYPKGIFSMFV